MQLVNSVRINGIGQKYGRRITITKTNFRAGDVIHVYKKGNDALLSLQEEKWGTYCMDVTPYVDKARMTINAVAFADDKYPEYNIIQKNAWSVLLQNVDIISRKKRAKITKGEGHVHGGYLHFSTEDKQIFKNDELLQVRVTRNKGSFSMFISNKVNENDKPLNKTPERRTEKDFSYRITRESFFCGILIPVIDIRRQMIEAQISTVDVKKRKGGLQITFPVFAALEKKMVASNKVKKICIAESTEKNLKAYGTKSTSELIQKKTEQIDEIEVLIKQAKKTLSIYKM